MNTDKPLASNSRRLLNAPFLLAFLLCVAALLPTAHAQEAPKTKSGFVTTSDEVKIHYIEAGERRTLDMYVVGQSPKNADGAKRKITASKVAEQPTLLLVPGWTMPAWIWEQQIAHFARTHRVVAMDPRGQGDSDKPAEGYYPAARARDIKAVVDQLKLAPVVLVGWSMGVTEIAAYVDQFGTEGIAAVVLVDGVAGGMDANFAKVVLELGAKLQQDRAKQTEAFIRSMYRKPQTEDYIQRVTQASLKTPTNAAMALFVGAERITGPRSPKSTSPRCSSPRGMMPRIPSWPVIGNW